MSDFSKRMNKLSIELAKITKKTYEIAGSSFDEKWYCKAGQHYPKREEIKFTKRGYGICRKHNSCVRKNLNNAYSEENRNWQQRGFGIDPTIALAIKMNADPWFLSEKKRRRL